MPSGEISLPPVPGRRAPSIRTRRRVLSAGYTLIEIMIVMTIISIMVSVAVPLYQKSIVRAKESVLKNNLFTMRQTIDEFTVDKQKAPQSLQELVSEGYLRQVPVDPMTGNDQWKIIIEDVLTAASTSEPGIFDVRSMSAAKSLEGTLYSEW